MTETKKKNGFASGIGFVLAAAGSAVGLGNLWGFPFKTGANGGAAFVIVYIICVILMGSVVLVAEMYLGRRAQANPITAYKKANKNLGFVGLLVIAIPFLIVCYYSVLGGWTFKFAANSFNLQQSINLYESHLQKLQVSSFLNKRIRCELPEQLLNLYDPHLAKLIK